MKKIKNGGIASFFLFLCFTAFLSLQAEEEKPRKIVSVDRNRILLEGGKWVQLTGLDMVHLANSKKTSLILGDEVDRYLRNFIGKEVSLEPEDPAGSSGYVYYLKPGAEVAPGEEQGMGSKPMLMVQEIRKNPEGTMQAKIEPYLRIMLNIEILKKGYGRVDTRKPFKRQSDFMLAENQARQAHAGIWE